MSNQPLRSVTVATLREAGCVAAEEEAAELIAAAGGDEGRLTELVERRCTGEPLAWLTGEVRFCGEQVIVRPGVYVPRWQSEALATAAVGRLPPTGVAVDLCTGAGAIAVVLARRWPDATVIATEVDPAAAVCARENGVAVFEGDMAEPLPRAFDATVDVVTAVVPYVPSAELRLLPRDVLAFEPVLALDGGPTGTESLRRAISAGARLLRPGGWLFLELGGDEAEQLHPVLESAGFDRAQLLTDEDGDLRGLSCRRR